MRRCLTGLALGLCLSTTTVHAHTYMQRPDAHAPAGVMGEHAHMAGQWMLSYRYTHMDMDGLRDGTGSVSAQEVATDFGYMVAPLEMTMDMHMFGVMYAPTDRLTLMAMAPYVIKSMDHRVVMGPMAGTEFSTQSEGFGDVKLSGVFKLWNKERRTLILNFGVSLPTGSIDEEDNTAASAGEDVQLPYPMQLGSGTYDLIPGLTYTDLHEKWSWGAQGLATLRLGENDNDYTLGDRYELTGWVARLLSASWSASLRLKGQDWDDINGSDPDLNPMIVPTADPDAQGGTRVDLSAGLNFIRRGGVLDGHRLAVEVARPVYQDLNGPQLETDWLLTLGWQYAF